MTHYLRACLWLPFVLAPWVAARAQDTCESTFKASGNVVTGLAFSVRIAHTGVSPADAITQMKSIGAEEGFKAGAEQGGASEASLVLMQEATAFARGFPFVIKATEGETVSMDATLPAGMATRADAVRSVMCGMLARLKPSAGALTAHTVAPKPLPGSERPPQASIPVPSPSPSPSPSRLAKDTDSQVAGASAPLPAPLTPETSGKLCLANWTTSQKDEAMTDIAFTTWTLGNEGEEAEKAIGRIKTGIGSMAGVRAGTETYHPKEGRLVVDIVSPQSFMTELQGKMPGNLKPFSVLVDYDGGMGSVSIVVPPNPSQAVDPNRLRYLACSIASMATGGTMPEPPKDGAKRSLFNNPFKRQVDAGTQLSQQDALQKQGKEKLLQRALYAGKAFVIMPAPDVGLKYWAMSEEQRRNQELVNYWLDLKAISLWQPRSQAGMPLKTGFRAGDDSEGLRGYVQSFSWQGARYGLYIVDPDTYDLTGAETEMRRASLPDATAVKWTGKPRLGSLSLSSTLDDEYFATPQWHDAVYDTRPYSTTYCVVEHRFTGECLSSNTQVTYQKREVIAAGYRDRIQQRKAAGLVLKTSLTAPLASFTVHAGDVAFVDGFVTDGGSSSINAKACKQPDSETMDCELSAFSVWRYYADKSLLGLAQRSADARAPALSKVLAGAKAVPVTLNPRVKKVAEAEGLIVDKVHLSIDAN